MSSKNTSRNDNDAVVVNRSEVPKSTTTKASIGSAAVKGPLVSDTAGGEMPDPSSVPMQGKTYTDAKATFGKKK